MVPEAVAEQDGEDGDEGEGFAGIGLDLHVVVEDAGDGGDVGEAMDGAPAFATKTLDHGVGGGDGERNHHDEGGDADEEVLAPAHLGEGAGDAERTIVAEEEEEVEADVKEGVEAEHAAQGDDPIPAAGFTQGRDRQGEHEEHERGHAGGEDGEVHRVGAELMVPGIPREQGDGHGTIHE